MKVQPALSGTSVVFIRFGSRSKPTSSIFSTTQQHRTGLVACQHNAFERCSLWIPVISHTFLGLAIRKGHTLAATVGEVCASVELLVARTLESSTEVDKGGALDRKGSIGVS